MQRDPLNNIHIQSEQVMITPAQLKEKLPISDRALAFVQGARNTIADIIHRRDHRLLVICGPCSIHDMDAAKEYATRLKALHDAYQDSLYIVMRVYFEKPRTTVGWKGFINDPNLDGTFDVELGLHRARELLCSSLLGLALVGGPLLAYFQHHNLLAEFKYYAFDIFFEGSYGNGFSPDVGSVGLLRTGLIMLLPAFIVLMMGRRDRKSVV